jgi:hypothetical protein
MRVSIVWDHTLKIENNNSTRYKNLCGWKIFLRKTAWLIKKPQHSEEHQGAHVAWCWIREALLKENERIHNWSKALWKVDLKDYLEVNPLKFGVILITLGIPNTGNGSRIPWGFLFFFDNSYSNSSSQDLPERKEWKSFQRLLSFMV